MNEQESRWQQQLEQATRREPLADEAWDAETADLRAGWQALSRLLEQADSRFPEQALLAELRKPVSGDSRRWLGIAALAASLLVAVAVGWLWSQAKRNSGVPGPSEVAERRLAGQSEAGSGDGEFLWNDSWDEKLAQLDQKFVSLRGWSSSGEVSLRVMDEQLQQIGREMDAEL